MSGFLRSGRGFAFSLEAGLSLLACIVFISMLSFHSHEDLSEVVIYKQASDFLDVVIKDGSLEQRDVPHMKSLLKGLGLKAKLYVDEELILDQSPRALVTIERTLVTQDLEYQIVILTVGV